MPIKVKLTLIIVVSSTFALLAASAGYLYYDFSAFRSRTAADLSTEAEVIGTNCAAAMAFNDKAAVEEVLRALHFRTQVDSAAVYISNGRLFARYVRPKAKHVVVPAVAQQEGIHLGDDGITVIRSIRSERDLVGTLYLHSSMQEWAEQRNRFAVVMGLLTLGSASLALAIGFRLQKMISGPITELTEAMRAVASHEQFDRRVTRRTEDEIGELVDGFNSMLTEVERGMLDRRAAQEKLLKSQQDLEDFFENATVALHWLAPDGTILRANRTELAMLGYAADEYIGHNMTEFYLDPSEILTGLARLANHEIVKNHEVTLCCRDGSYKQVACDSNVLWEGDKFVHTRCFTRDMTAQKEAERARLDQEQAERSNKAKSEFLSRMSHELRTPMNAIMGFSQILALDDLTEDQQDSVDRLASAGKHLLGLINEVLDLSRIEAGNLAISNEAVSINDVVVEVLSLVKPLADSRGIQLANLATYHSETHVLADRQRLSQVLLNLVSNAIKYNNEDGEVWIAAEVIEGTLRITVTDTGPGIATEKAPLLFTPFERLGAEQTSVEGTGLGLALSKRLTEAMGGAIGIYDVAEGACFFVDLPLAENPMAAVETQSEDVVSEAVEESDDRLTILLVEDNLSNVRLMEKVLGRRRGMHIIHAACGEAAITLARKHSPDVILLDLNLPDMHGQEVLAQLRKFPETAETPVLVVSADATASQIARLREAGAAGYITKPIAIDVLFAAIDGCLNQENRLIA